jgi:hypothetical protein
MKFDLKLPPMHIGLAGIFLAFTLLACAPPTKQAMVHMVQPTEAPTATPTQPPSLCDNPLFPVRPGATWTYSSSGSSSGPYSFTDTITEVRADGFTLTSQFPGLTRTQEWACRPEGLVALTMSGGPAASLSSSGMTLNFQTSNVSGLSLPAAVAAGDHWPYALEVQGTITIAEGQSAEGSGAVGFSSTAMGIENVTVPAGTFEAMKVRTASDIRLSVNYLGLPIPVNVTGSYFIWYAPGVGWVKMEGTGKVLGTDYSEVILLEAYDIP